MFGKNEKLFQETEAAFTAAGLLINFTVIAAAFAVVWLSYALLLVQSSRLEFFMRVVPAN